MSEEYTVYKIDTGAYVKNITAPDKANIDLNIAEDEFGVEGIQPIQSYVKDGEVKMMPEPPENNYVFDHGSETWIDPRTDGEKLAELQNRRNLTEIDKSTLLGALATLGVFTWEEADAASNGVIPAHMEEMMAELPPDVQAMARIKWRSDAVISRMNPVIVLAAYALGITDEQLDAIFGVV